MIPKATSSPGLDERWKRLQDLHHTGHLLETVDQRARDAWSAALLAYDVAPTDENRQALFVAAEAVRNAIRTLYIFQLTKLISAIEYDIALFFHERGLTEGGQP